jgi:mono/diheme cytochrome c family protein
LRDADQDVLGRPVDVAEGPDGAIYVSDDYAGSIYRVAWGEEQRAAPEAPLEGAAGRGPSPSKGAAALAAIEPAERDAARERGRALFEKNQCGTCHVPAQAPPGMVSRPLVGLASRHDLDDLSAYLRAPRPPMPVFPLSAQELRDVGVYLLITYP